MKLSLDMLGFLDIHTDFQWKFWTPLIAIGFLILLLLTANKALLPSQRELLGFQSMAPNCPCRATVNTSH